MIGRRVVACIALCALTAARAAGTLTVCAEGSPEGFDIAQYETVNTSETAGLPLYDQLLHFKPGATELQPGLAETWTISPDGLVYTFKLRRGVKFHTTPYFTPTRDFDADDVVWSLQRQNDKSHPGYAAAKNGWVYWSGMNLPTLVRSVEKVDPLTVRITLTRPESPFLADLAMTSIGSIVSAEYAQALVKAGRADQLNVQPIGTGPFVFKSYQKDASVRYAANTAYWGPKPKVDNLIYAITVDPSVRVQRVKAGECLVSRVVPPADREFAGHPRIAIDHSRPIRTTYIAPNARHPALADKRMREALWLAIDKKNLIQSVYGGLAVPTTTFLPLAMWSADATLPERHDLARAKQLVRDSGYDGRELSLFTVAGRADNKRAAEILQADWAAIGVKVRVELMELGELYKRTGRGDHDLTFLSWFGDNGDPDNFFTPNLSCAASDAGGNKAHWCNPAFDKLLDEARRSSDVATRTRLYKQAQRLLYDEVGLIPIANPTGLTAIHKNVSGVVLTPFGNTDYRGAALQP